MLLLLIFNLGMKGGFIGGIAFIDSGSRGCFDVKAAVSYNTHKDLSKL
jgi:hypothetical protein